MNSIRLAMILSIAISGTSVAEEKGQEKKSADAIPTSMVKLLIFPEKYLEKKVKVGGYVMFYDGWRIFLTCEHAHQFDRESSMILVKKPQDPEDSKKLIKGWAYIEGTLRLAKNGRYFIESEGNFLFQYGQDKDWYLGQKREIPPMPHKDDPLPPMPTCHE